LAKINELIIVDYCKIKVAGLIEKILYIIIIKATAAA